MSTTAQEANMMMFTTEAKLDLQVAPTPSVATVWPHWGWGVVLAIALMVLGIMGVVCCCRR